MSWIIGILTFILVLNSLFLILLILVQLPKKEAGLGTAFGSSTTDALFGAGTGNVLTKLTKYCTIIFFVITLSLSVMNAHQSRAKKSTLEEALKTVRQEESGEVPVVTNQAAPTNPLTAPLTTDLTNAVLTATNVTGTNATVPLLTPPPPPPAPVEPPKTPETPETPAKPAEPPAGDPPTAPKPPDAQ